jgi:hypothetical protein
MFEAPRIEKNPPRSRGKSQLIQEGLFDAENDREQERVDKLELAKEQFRKALEAKQIYPDIYIDEMSDKWERAGFYDDMMEYVIPYCFDSSHPLQYLERGKRLKPKTIIEYLERNQSGNNPEDFIRFFYYTNGILSLQDFDLWKERIQREVIPRCVSEVINDNFDLSFNDLIYDLNNLRERVENFGFACDWSRMRDNVDQIIANAFRGGNFDLVFALYHFGIDIQIPKEHGVDEPIEFMDNEALQDYEKMYVEDKKKNKYFFEKYHLESIQGMPHRLERLMDSEWGRSTFEEALEELSESMGLKLDWENDDVLRERFKNWILYERGFLHVQDFITLKKLGVIDVNSKEVKDLVQREYNRFIEEERAYNFDFLFILLKETQIPVLMDQKMIELIERRLEQAFNENFWYKGCSLLDSLRKFASDIVTPERIEGHFWRDVKRDMDEDEEFDLNSFTSGVREMKRLGVNLSWYIPAHRDTLMRIHARAILEQDEKTKTYLEDVVGIAFTGNEDDSQKVLNEEKMNIGISNIKKEIMRPQLREQLNETKEKERRIGITRTPEMYQKAWQKIIHQKTDFKNQSDFGSYLCRSNLINQPNWLNEPFLSFAQQGVISDFLQKKHGTTIEFFYTMGIPKEVFTSMQGEVREKFLQVYETNQDWNDLARSGIFPDFSKKTIYDKFFSSITNNIGSGAIDYMEIAKQRIKFFGWQMDKNDEKKLMEAIASGYAVADLSSRFIHSTEEFFGYSFVEEPLFTLIAQKVHCKRLATLLTEKKEKLTTEQFFRLKEFAKLSFVKHLEQGCGHSNALSFQQSYENIFGKDTELSKPFYSNLTPEESKKIAMSYSQMGDHLENWNQVYEMTGIKPDLSVFAVQERRRKGYVKCTKIKDWQSIQKDVEINGELDGSIIDRSSAFVEVFDNLSQEEVENCERIFRVDLCDQFVLSELFKISLKEKIIVQHYEILQQRYEHRMDIKTKKFIDERLIDYADAMFHTGNTFNEIEHFIELTGVKPHRDAMRAWYARQFSKKGYIEESVEKIVKLCGEKVELEPKDFGRFPKDMSARIWATTYQRYLPKQGEDRALAISYFCGHSPLSACIPELLAMRGPSRREEFCPYKNAVEPLFFNMGRKRKDMEEREVQHGIIVYFKEFGFQDLPILANVTIELMKCDDPDEKVACEKLKKVEDLADVRMVHRLFDIRVGTETPKSIIERMKKFKEELAQDILADRPLPVGMEYNELAMELFNSLVPYAGSYANKGDRGDLIANMRNEKMLVMPPYLVRREMNVEAFNESDDEADLEDQNVKIEALKEAIVKKASEEPLQVFLFSWRKGMALEREGQKEPKWWFGRLKNRLERAKTELEEKLSKVTQEKGRIAIQKQIDAIGGKDGGVIARINEIEERLIRKILFAEEEKKQPLAEHELAIEILKGFQSMYLDSRDHPDLMTLWKQAGEELYALTYRVMKHYAPNHIANIEEAERKNDPVDILNVWSRYFKEEYLEHFNQMGVAEPQIPRELTELVSMLWRTKGIIADLKKPADKKNQPPKHVLGDAINACDKIRERIQRIESGEPENMTMKLAFNPVVGIGRVLSGDIANACYNSKRNGLAKGEYPDLRALILSLPEERDRIAGSVLCIEARNVANERVLVIRALNPTEPIIQRKLDPKSVVLATAEYFIKSAEESEKEKPEDPIKEVHLCYDHSGGHSTNRKLIFAAEGDILKDEWKVAKRSAGLVNTPETNFNKYRIYVEGETRVIWRKE